MTKFSWVRPPKSEVSGMYKKTAKSLDHRRRTGSAAVTPKLTAQDDDGLNAGGIYQLAMSDGRFTSELERQKLLQQKAEVEKKIGKLSLQISNAKYNYQTNGIGTDPRFLHKWETERRELGQKIQDILSKIAYVNRLRKIENSIVHNMQFIEVAREILHPDVFYKIQDLARQRAGQKIMLNEVRQLI